MCHFKWNWIVRRGFCKTISYIELRNIKTQYEGEKSDSDDFKYVHIFLNIRKLHRGLGFLWKHMHFCFRKKTFCGQAVSPRGTSFYEIRSLLVLDPTIITEMRARWAERWTCCVCAGDLAEGTFQPAQEWEMRHREWQINTKSPQQVICKGKLDERDCQGGFRAGWLGKLKLRLGCQSILVFLTHFFGKVLFTGKEM